MNRLPMSVTAQRGMLSKKPQSSIAVTIDCGRVVFVAEPTPEDLMIVVMTPWAISKSASIRSSPYVTTPFAIANLMNSFRAAMCDGTPSTLVAPTVNVTGSYTNCSSSDASHSTEKYQPYTAIITPDSGYTLEGAAVSVIMGGTDITATAYNNGEIYIPSVTGALSISVAAVVDAPSELFDPDTATMDSEINYRLNSSGAAVAQVSQYNYSVIGVHILVTDFIPISGSDVLDLLADHTQDANSYSGFISIYDSSKTHLKQVIRSNGNWIWDSSKTEGSIDISGLRNLGVDLSAVAYCRLCIAYDDISSISVTKH